MANQRIPKLEEIVGLDLRSLAIFRIGLALATIADLVSRVQALNAHYTDFGVLPRAALIDEILRPWYWSIHLIAGQPLVQALLFLLAASAALAMLVGYRTRLATIVTWALTVSIQNRNPALLFAADDVLRAILFWAMFLPLGASYSIDSALNSSTKPLPKRVCSGATFAFIIQLCYIYMWSAAFKTTSETWWPDGSAVYYALSFDQYVTGFGEFLLSFPSPVLKVLTFASLIFEWVGPLLLFIPFRTSFFRCVVIISFILLHVGFELCFDIGMLSFLSIANWLALIPSSVWDAAAKRLENPQRRGLRIYYDADCGFCKKAVHLIRTFLILPGTPLLLAQDDASIYDDMQKNNSWVVVDWQENRHFKFEAIVYVCSLSPIFWMFVPLLRWNAIMIAGTKFYETIASNRRAAGRLTRPLQFRPISVNSSRIFDVTALFLLLILSLWNFKNFVDQPVSRRRQIQDDWFYQVHRFFTRRPFQAIAWLPGLTRLDQNWSIFAPSPPKDDGWHVIVGKVKDGNEIDILQENETISWEKPTVKQRKDLYKTIQWRVYFINLNRAIGQKLYPHFVQYLCQEWNSKQGGEKRLDSVTIYFMDERTVAENKTQKVEKKKHWQQSCSPNSKRDI